MLLVLKFKNVQYQIKDPIIIYCDSECILKKLMKKEIKYITINELPEPMSL